MAKVSTGAAATSEPVALMASASSSDQTMDLQRDVSLFVLIKQAVASKDAVLLERVFQVQDCKMIEAAVSQTKDITVLYGLLDAALERLQRRPMRAPFLLPWLRSVLRIHAVLLIKAGRCKPRLAPLMRLAAARSKSWRRMMTLCGRLDLLCAHHAVDRTEKAVVMVPSVVYNFDAECEDDDEQDVLPSDQQLSEDSDADADADSDEMEEEFSSESEIDVE